MDSQLPSSICSISDPDFWSEYIEHKKSSFPNNPRISEFEKVLEDRSFSELMSHISDGSYTFSIPVKKSVSKTKVGKKRTVYTFEEQEMMALRIISYSLYRFDEYFSNSLYSFRSSRTVRDAIIKIRFTSLQKRSYGLKIDIHDYFNSIPVDRFLPMLKDFLQDDPLYGTLDCILSSR